MQSFVGLLYLHLELVVRYNILELVVRYNLYTSKKIMQYAMRVNIFIYICYYIL